MFKEFFNREEDSALVVYIVREDSRARIYRTATGKVDMERVKCLEAEGFRPTKAMLNGRYDDSLVRPTLSETIAVAQEKCKLDEFLPTFYVCGGEYETGFDIEQHSSGSPYVYVLHPYRNGLTTYAVKEDGTIVAIETGFLCGPRTVKLSQKRIKEIQDVIHNRTTLMVC